MIHVYVVQLPYDLLAGFLLGQSPTSNFTAECRIVYSLGKDRWPALSHSTKSSPLHTLILLPYVHSELRF
jgi:hypothetical protein